MEFKNVENQKYATTCGKEIWKSRNVAVCVCIVRTNPDDGTRLQVLATERGEDMTHSGKFCFPCGYLDWDETVPMAASREVFEETDLEIVWSDLDFVELDSDPNKFSQNVTVHFLAYYTGDKQPRVKNEREVKSLAWYDMEEAKNLDWAFDHKKRVENLICSQF